MKHLMIRSLGSLLIFLYRPVPDAEISLFCIHSRSRRRGHGRRMVNSFLDSVRRAKNIYVVTHSVSDWQFYERFGFKRVKEWREYSFRYSIPNQRVMAYLYLYQL